MEAGKRKSLRKRMRDLARTFDKTADPVTIEQKKQKLADLKLVKKLVLKTTHLYSKYKTIRFFGTLHAERRKLERKLKQAQKTTDTDASHIQRIMSDLSYVKNYPLNYKYVSLFAEDSELTVKYRELMRKLIQKSLSRKAQHREKVLREEGIVEEPEETEDPFFAEDDSEVEQFQNEVRAEDVEEPEQTTEFRPVYKRKREEKKEKEESGETRKRTHIRFTE